MKLGPDMYHLNTFDIPKYDGVNKWAGGGHNQKITRKCHEIKRIATFASSKTNSDNAKEKGIFSLPSMPCNSSVDINWGRGGFNPPYRGSFLLESNFSFKSAPHCNQNCTFLILAESIIFLHIASFLCWIYFCKILQHPKINSGSAPVILGCQTLWY